MENKDILHIAQRSKNFIDADSEDENVMTNVNPIPTLSEMWKIMKSMCNYLEAHSNSEKNFKVDDIEQLAICDAKKVNAKEKKSDYFPKT
ncbi:hypothetical protein TNCV_239251 [Trichonephila clavipes]|nr:hypothetical protein TNCV_239251 [Trichonephila clavipes]